MSNTAEMQVSPAAKRMKKNTSEGLKGIYENWDFPPYEYREYPKMISLGDKRRVLVQSKREEVERLAESPLPTTVANPLTDENDNLRKQLADMQEQMDKLLKLTHAKIDEAQKPAQTAKAEVTATPPKPAAPPVAGKSA